VHPTILSLIVKVGREFGLRAIRIPYEPFGPAWRATRSHFGSRLAQSLFLSPWLALMKRRLQGTGIAANDFVFGMIDTGHMDTRRMRGFIAQLPSGISEIYSHPATARWPEADPPDADYAGEFAALIDPAVIGDLHASNVKPATFSDLARDGV